MADLTYAHDAQCNSPHEAGPEPCPPAVTGALEPEDVSVIVCSWISQYTVSLLPRDHPWVNQFAVRVQSAGPPDEWMVITGEAPEVWRSRVKSEISWRILPQDPEWRSSYVFALPRALTLALEVAAIRTVNGLTALDVRAKEGESHDEHVPVNGGVVVPEPDPGPEGAVSAGPPYAGRHRPALDSDLQPRGSRRGD